MYFQLHPQAIIANSLPNRFSCWWLWMWLFKLITGHFGFLESSTTLLAAPIKMMMFLFYQQVYSSKCNHTCSILSFLFQAQTEIYTHTWVVNGRFIHRLLPFHPIYNSCVRQWWLRCKSTRLIIISLLNEYLTLTATDSQIKEAVSCERSSARHDATRR